MCAFGLTVAYLCVCLFWLVSRLSVFWLVSHLYPCLRALVCQSLICVSACFLSFTCMCVRVFLFVSSLSVCLSVGVSSFAQHTTFQCAFESLVSLLFGSL